MREMLSWQNGINCRLFGEEEKDISTIFLQWNLHKKISFADLRR
jgi:hypothetical protein